MGMAIQQQLVIERLDANLKYASAATDKLRNKATTVFASSVALMSFVSAGEMLGTTNAVQSTLICVSLIFGGVLSWIAIGLFLPSTASLPGCDDAEALRDQYLDVSEDDAVCQVVSDMASCLADARTANRIVGRSMQGMLRAFLAQILCVAAAVATRVVCG